MKHYNYFSIKHRLFSLLLAALMILTSMGLSALPTIVTAEGDGETQTENTDFTIRDDAQHFFIRHWHTREDKSAAYQGDDQKDKDSGKFFVVVEGYILPDKTTKGAPYKIVLCNQSDDSLIELTEGYKDSPYVGGFDLSMGTVTLNIRPLMDDDAKDPLENFCGLSMSAGSDAVQYNYLKDGDKFVLDENGNKQMPSITIKYSSYSRLVKGHVFYNTWSKIVAGTTNEKILGKNAEVDTAEVYTWTEAVDGNAVGDVYLLNGETVSDISLVEEKYRSKVKLTKFYSAKAGMHTDMTMIAQDESGRLFLFDLEAWYVEGYAAQLGFVLDASGSMAFTSDRPSVINVYDAIANRLDVTPDANGQYVYKSEAAPDVELTEESSKALIEALDYNMSNEEALQKEVLDTISDKIGSEFSKDNWDALLERIGAISKAVENNTTAVDKSVWNSEVFLNSEELSVLLNPQNTANTPIGVAAYNYFVYDGYSSTKEYTPLGYWAGLHKTAPDRVPSYNFADSYYDNKQVYEDKIFDTKKDPVNGWAYRLNGDMHMEGSYGYHLSGMDGEKAPSTAGLILDVKPTGSFTVSFALLKRGADPTDNVNKTIAELMFIGSAAGDVNNDDGHYYRLYRDQEGSSGRLRASSGPNRNADVTDINGAFDDSQDTKKRITLVFDKNSDATDDYSYTVTSYMDGSVGVQKEENGVVTSAPNDGTQIEFKDGDISIILNAFKDYYNGASIYFTDLCVFDKALDAGWISSNLSKYDSAIKPAWITDDKISLSGWYKFTYDKTTNDQPNGGESRSWLRNSAVKWIKDKGYEADQCNTSYGSFACKILDGDRPYAMNNWKSIEAVPTHATITNDSSREVKLGELINSNGTGGWFYVSHTGWKSGPITDGTAKQMFAMTTGEASDKVDLPGEAKSGCDTGASFESESDEPTKFYIDAKGDLRCFFSRVKEADKKSGPQCSYVYELSDKQYVKTEALQRILANFAVNLFERSPSSQISAVKFSGDVSKAEDLKRTVLLDWSHDPQEIAGIMSQVYGSRTANDSELSARGVAQYNYALTGGTATQAGLQSFYDNLVAGHDVDGDGNEIDENTPKFLIIFTDGTDDNMAKEGKPSDKAFDYADKLKKAGYTIIGVYLPAGTDYDENGKFTGSNEDGVLVGSDTYKGAMNFLPKIASREDYVFVSTALDGILEIFEKEILAKIVDSMEKYNVQNYIDPRFDLQTADGTTWKLKSNGDVEIKFDKNDKISMEEFTNLKKYFKDCEYKIVGENDDKEDKIIVEFTATDSSAFTFHISGYTSADAHDPFLRFDAKKDMYYLLWDEQTIPTTPVGADSLRVWNARVILKAKDDFLGGNAIITNGNEANMNWVYHPGDVEGADREKYPDNPNKPFGRDASSGTDDMEKEYDPETNELIDAYPSKGFPRATVNVQLLPLSTAYLDGIMYMGELVSPAQLLTDIKDKYVTDTYYLEYLKRYAYQRYLYNGGPENKEQMNMPLLDLLHEWLEFKNEEVAEKSFSIPYIYLPGVKYDDVSGKIELNNDGYASTITNNTGNLNDKGRFDALNADVLGILTYEWQQLEPKPKNAKEPTEDFVKANTERSKYSITVEFTPLREGDTFGDLNKCDDEYATNPNAKIFAGYIPFVNDNGNIKVDFTDDFNFNREHYVNNVLIKEKDAEEETVFKWIPEYKPAVYDEQLNASAEYGQTNNVNVKVVNDNRTLAGYTEYTLDVVSGGIALELNMLIGELTEALGLKYESELNDTIELKTTFKMKATRLFQDTNFAEKIKSSKSGITDFDRVTNVKDSGIYTITFSLNYSGTDIAKLEKDDCGYVTLFAKATEIKCQLGADTKILHELPIGTYQFKLDDADTLLEKIHFGFIDYETDEKRFNAAYGYFDELVLNGINTTNEKLEGVESSSVKWRDGKENQREITADNITAYKAHATSNNQAKTATFYIGTTENNVRGNEKYDSEEKRYTDNRLGVVVLTTGFVKLTIRETGADNNKDEFFLYRITGRTLGGHSVDLVVSVNSNSYTTVLLLPGNYVVTELSEWSWKYENIDTNGKEGETWDINKTNKEALRTASTTLRFINDDPLQEHKTVTFTHDKYKHWYGDELFSEE